MIAIAGGTGRLGSLVARRLTERDLEVRVITRDPARAAHLRDLPAQIVTADVRDRLGIRAAITGTTTVISAVHGFAGPTRVSPESVDRDGNANLIDAAAGLDVDVILISVVGASPEHPMELFRAKHAAEQHLIHSGAAWTIVRATAFVELWSEIMRKPIVFGRGENPINFVSVGDVAAVVERAVMEQGQRGRVIEVGGPRNLTFNELASLLKHARGQSGKVRHIPRPALQLAARFSRQARAAIAMDTIDMTFTPQPAPPDQPLTEPRDTLEHFAASASSRHSPAPIPGAHE
ncbi:MAG: SDR family oxidoreductase [Solirubrobacterales bacterium]|nr:SDR family oxidoreductase [Solirubrobacterales bacterium]